MGRSFSPHPAPSPSPPATSSGEGETHRERSPPTTAALPRPDRPYATKTRTRPTEDNTLLDSILGGRNISEIPPADLAALIGSLSRHDPGLDRLAQSRRYYQLQLLLTKLPAGALAELADAISSDPALRRQGGLPNLLTFLAGKDPGLALHWLSTHENSSEYYPAVISSIAREDPYKAANLFEKYLLDGTLTSSRLWIASNGIGSAMAKLGATPLLDFIDKLPENRQTDIAENAFQSLPASERILLLTEILKRNADGRTGNITLAPLFNTYLRLDQAGASEWFAKLPEGDGKETLRRSAAFSLIQSGEKEAAAEWVRGIFTSSPGKEIETLGNYIGGMVYLRPTDIPYYAALLPDGLEFTAKDFESIAMESVYSSIGGLTSIASAIRNPAEQAHLIAGTIDKLVGDKGSHDTLNPADLEILSRRISTMGFTGENAALVNAALEAARNPKPADAE